MKHAFSEVKCRAIELVAGHVSLSAAASLGTIATAAALLIGAPKHYVAVLHATPGAAAIPIDWILATDKIKHEVVVGLDLTKHYGGVAESVAIKELKRSTKVTKSFGSAVDIEVADQSPDMAARIATAYGRSVFQMTLDQRLSRSSALLYEVRIRKMQAVKYLREAEQTINSPIVAAAIQSIPTGWIELINSSGPVLAINALNSVGPYQTNGPSSLVLETQRLAVLAATLQQQDKRAQAPFNSDVLLNAIKALQEISFWKALESGMQEQEEILLDRVKTETANPAVQVPTEETWVYEMTPWVAGVLLAFGGTLMALLIAKAIGERPRGVAQT